MFLHGKTECTYMCVIFSLSSYPFSLRYIGTWRQMRAVVPPAWLCQPHPIKPMTNTETLTGKAIWSGNRKSSAHPLRDIKISQQCRLFLRSRELTVILDLALTPHFIRDVNKQRRLAPEQANHCRRGQITGWSHWS